MIPADPAARVINVVLYMNFAIDRWITGIDYQPTSRDLLSHAVVFAAPATMPIDDEDVLPGFAGLVGVPSGTNIGDQLSAVNRSLETLGVWTPAGRVSSTPEGTALRLPKGHNIVLQFNVRPTDTGAIEDGTVAIYFSKTQPASPLTPVQVPASFGIAAGIDLPAGEPRVVVKDEFTLPIETIAFGARGHAHDLARDLKMTARLPNGSLRGLAVDRSLERELAGDVLLRGAGPVAEGHDDSGRDHLRQLRRQSAEPIPASTTGDVGTDAYG